MHRRIVRNWWLIGALIWTLASVAHAARWVVSLPALAHWVRPMLLPGDTLTVLLQPGQSPHHWALKPSQLQALAQADRIVLVSPALEAPLYRWARAHRRPLIVWSQLPGVTRLRGAAHAHHATDPVEEAAHAALAVNPHLWLSPVNGRILTHAVAQAQRTLHARDGVEKRLQSALTQIDAMDRAAKDALAPVRKVPYLVLHDAFAYFDAYYRLNKVGVIEPPAGGVGLKRLLAMRARLQRAGVRCVLYPAHEDPRLLRALVRGLPVRIQAVDVLGWRHDVLESWFAAIVEAYGRCLRPS